MPQESFGAIFSPRSIAVVEASDRTDSVSGSDFANLIGVLATAERIVALDARLITGTHSYQPAETKEIP